MHFAGVLDHLDRDSPIMHGSVPDEFKPVIFEAGQEAMEWMN